MNSSAQAIPAHAARPPSPVLRLDNVSVRYGKQTALQHASFQVEPGQLMALVGPSGCGKSSLLASINRMTDLVPGCVVDGAIVLGEDDVRAPTMAVHQLRRRVGMVFQQPNVFPMSIAQNIMFPLREHGVRNAHELRARVEAALRCGPVGRSAAAPGPERADLVRRPATAAVHRAGAGAGAAGVVV